MGFLHGQNLDSVVFTSEGNFNSYREYTKIKFKSVEVIDYKRELVEHFYENIDWGISHSCFKNEPFGYSIFQSIDYGKVPVLSKEWCKDMKYPWRDKLLSIYNQDGDEVWLPTDISPSKNV